jgi:hypothetical protein
MGVMMTALASQQAWDQIAEELMGADLAELSDRDDDPDTWEAEFRRDFASTYRGAR